MPELKYTTSLRDQAGQTNSATPLTDNLSDIEDIATTGFDFENIEQWSLDQSHIYDGGGSPEPLKAAFNDYDDGPTAFGGLNAWEDIVSVAVTAESGVSGVYVWAGLRTDQTASPTHTQEIRIHDGAAAVAASVRDIGSANGRTGGGHTIHAFQAASGSFTVKLQARVDAGLTHDWHDAFITVVVVSR